MDNRQTIDGVRSAETLTIADDRPRERSRAPIERGTTLGRYLVIDEVGEGGMGVVMRAYDPKLHREIAIKQLHRDVLDAEAEARLLREAQAMAQLSHPNVVTIYDVERTEQGVVMAMEYVEGQTLSEWIEGGPHPWPLVLQHFEQAGRGLQAAHIAGLVHRDFKPGNVIIGPDGRLRVMDFGLARADVVVTGDPQTTDVDREFNAGAGTGVSASVEIVERPVHDDRTGRRAAHRSISESDIGGSLSEQLTQAGAVIGTPGYMSPEQHVGETADARSDQYAFCVSLWEALTGSRPFRGNLLTLAHLKHKGPPAIPRSSKVPRRLFDALRRGMSPRPHDRWPSMAELIEVLLDDPARRRRQWVLAGGVVLATGGLVAAVAWPTPEQAPCQDAAERLEGVWDDARRSEVRAALQGTELSYAAPTWDRVSTRLDDYAERWVQMHTEACEATAVRREQSEALLDLRMQCLRRRALYLGAVVDVLAAADADVAETAIQQVMGLPPIERCADVDALTAAVAPPEHPEVATLVEQLRDELTPTKALTGAGRYADARPLVDSILERSAATGYDPLHAEVLAVSSTLAKHQGQIDRAFEEATEAYELAVRSGADAVAAQTATDIMFITGNHQAKLEAGWAWATTARALAQRTDPSGADEAMVLNGMGILAYRGGDFAQATTYFQQALSMQTEVFGEDNDQVATTLNHLGAMLDEQGRYAEAEPHFRRALEIQLAVFGPEHPRRTLSMGNLALCLQGQGRNEEARDIHLESLQIRVNAVGDKHPDTALTHNNLGWDYMGLGEAETAMTHFTRAREIFELLYGPEHPRVAMTIESLAITSGELSRYDDSERYHKEALAMRQKTLGEDHPNVALSLAGLGNLAFKRERYDESIEWCQKALAVIEARSEGAERYLSEILTSLGRALARSGRYGDARPHLTRALELHTEAQGTDPALIANVRLYLAETAWGEGKTEEALAAARKGLAEAKESKSKLAGETREQLEAWLREHSPTQAPR